MAIHSSILAGKISWTGAYWATVHGVESSQTRLKAYEGMHLGHFFSFRNSTDKDRMNGLIVKQKARIWQVGRRCGWGPSGPGWDCLLRRSLAQASEAS